jgi:hypothetical protein
MIQLGNKIRLSKDKESEIKIMAAQKGYAIGSIRTPEDYIGAALKTMNDETLVIMDELAERIIVKKKI